jgi:prepilin-type N-terminal cleavage/methylation domain-containing protein
MVKKGFSMIEILVAMVLLGILVVISIKSMKLINQNSTFNEVRFLALNRADSELNRVVYTYATKPTIITYVSSDADSTDVSSPSLSTTALGSYKIYKLEPTSNNLHNLGLLINDGVNNIVELKDIGGHPNEIEDSDIVGVIGWNSINDTTNPAFTNGVEEITLALKYPYRYENNTLTQLFEFTETITLKTAVRR